MPTHSPYDWLAEPIRKCAAHERKSMFGCVTYYLDGLLALVLPQGREEPWKGPLFPAEKTQHASIQRQFHGLLEHSDLAKWLYLSESDPNWENTATELVRCITTGDTRFGTLSEKRRRKQKQAQKAAPDGRPPHLL